MKEVEAFLTENPTEIVTVIIEDYVRAPKALINLFINAGLDKYWFPVSDMPKRGEDWPTITQMVQANHRLLVFTSDASKEAEEGIAYQWRYMVENECKSNVLIRLMSILYISRLFSWINRLIKRLSWKCLCISCFHKLSQTVSQVLISVDKLNKPIQTDFKISCFTNFQLEILDFVTGLVHVEKNQIH